MEAGVVLLVDDDPDDRELMADLLREAGHAVIEAHDGKISLSSVPGSGTTVDIRLPKPRE